MRPEVDGSDVGEDRGTSQWRKGEYENAKVSGEAPALAPSKHNKGLTGEECASPPPKTRSAGAGVRLSGGL